MIEHSKKPGRTPRPPLERLRTKLWYARLEQSLAVPAGRSAASLLAETFDTDTQQRWQKYARGEISPSHTTLARVEQRLPGTRMTYDEGPACLFLLLKAERLGEAFGHVYHSLQNTGIDKHLDSAYCKQGFGWAINTTSLLSKIALENEEGEKLLPHALCGALLCQKYLGCPDFLYIVGVPAVEFFCRRWTRVTRQDITLAIPALQPILDGDDLIRNLGQASSELCLGDFGESPPFLAAHMAFARAVTQALAEGRRPDYGRLAAELGVTEPIVSEEVE